MVCASLAVPSAPAFAASTTGTITGTIVDAATGAPITDATVSAVSPSGSQASTTNAKGFYVLQNLLPDTYTVSVTAKGFQSESFPGITVIQDLTVTQNVHLTTALKTIANVEARSSGSLVKPDVTSDSYTVTGAQLNALSLGNDTHKTLYQYVATIPGITGSGFPAQPRVHGGSAADISYEFDGIPINDQMSGLFTTNLSNVGIGSILVSTGGLNASQSASGIGIINTVVKAGTYPGFADFTYAATPQYRNIYETAEYGGATPNQKFSWFFSLDNTNALNEYTSGQTYPLEVIEQGNGPGKITTIDLVGNLHYRPTDKDDIQFLIQNGLGEFGFGYLMARAPGEAPPLTFNMCPGAVSVTDDMGNSPTATGGQGGTAPNGAYCPEGLYFGTASTQHDGGNYWHHYSGLGKLQWNHIINDHSNITLRVSENYNQYIFDQPIADSNLPYYQNNYDVSDTDCPAYPYAPGTPVEYENAPGTTPITPNTDGPNPGAACAATYIWYGTPWYEDRSSNLYSGSITYDNTLNANADIEIGLGTDYSNNRDMYDMGGWFNAPGTVGYIYPALGWDASYPTHTPYIYAQGDFQVHKFKFSPGLRYTDRKYDYPIDGGASSRALNPNFAFNYAAGRNDVIIGSFTDSTSLIASAYVYRYTPPGIWNGPVSTPGTAAYAANYYCNQYNEVSCGTSPQQTRTHSYNLMWEHQIGANTSIKFGPYYNSASNILIDYRPYVLSKTDPPTWVSDKLANSTISNSGRRNGFGFEFGLNHNDPRQSGVSYWVAMTYVNFWTNTLSSLTTPYGSIQLPPSTKGVLFRSTQNPPISGSITADFHMNGLHFIPQLYMQSGVVSYTGTIPSGTCTNAFSNCGAQITAVPFYSRGYGILNATAEMQIGKKRDWVVGVQGTNVLNNNNPIFPTCSSASALPLMHVGLGCGALRPAGDNSVAPGAIAGHASYLTINQSSPLFLFFITKKL